MSLDDHVQFNGRPNTRQTPRHIRRQIPHDLVEELKLVAGTISLTRKLYIYI